LNVIVERRELPLERQSVQALQTIISSLADLFGHKIAPVVGSQALVLKLNLNTTAPFSFYSDLTSLANDSIAAAAANNSAVAPPEASNVSSALSLVMQQVSAAMQPAQTATRNMTSLCVMAQSYFYKSLNGLTSVLYTLKTMHDNSNKDAIVSELLDASLQWLQLVSEAQVPAQYSFSGK